MRSSQRFIPHIFRLRSLMKTERRRFNYNVLAPYRGEIVFIWSPNEFLISLLLTWRYQGHKWRKQPITWLCSPWWTSAGASAERQITNDDAIVVRHNNIVISPGHLLPGAVVLWVRCNMSLLIHASSLNLWEHGVSAYQQLFWEGWWLRDDLIFMKEHQSGVTGFTKTPVSLMCNV